MTPSRFDYHRIKSGNYDVLKGFLLALCVHGVLFFVGGRLSVKPVQYSVQSANGGIEVDLVAALPQPNGDTVRPIVSTMEQPQETVKLPQPDVEVVKPITPSIEKQQEAVKIVPQEEQITIPQLDIGTVKSITPATEKKEETVERPTQPAVDETKSITSTIGKPRETVKFIPRPSQGMIKAKSKPGYFQNRPPRYPPLAKKLHQEGLVMLIVEVNQKGVPVKVDVEHSSGYQLLDQAALKAVRHWRFQPGLIGGMPVESKVSIPIRFRMEE
ncbi:MAG: energy transducer TonB [Candidatus Scalindua sp.]|nr:energy transducer TonB [Candidatus Scalindua sp.]